MSSKEKSESRSMVTFLIHGQEYGMKTEAIRSIIPVGDMTFVPGAPPSVAGVINLRGDIIPVVELEGTTRDDDAPWEEGLALVVEIPDDAEDLAVALMVDEVTQVDRADFARIEDTDELMVARDRADAVIGVLSRADGPLLILDPAGLVPEEKEVGA